MVRTKIKDFAQQAVSRNEESVGNYPNPPFKIIILDEADAMTFDAQAALRRTMETYSKVTRFCIICNYISRIIEPLASRCAKFRFKPLSKADTTSALKKIIQEEKISESFEDDDPIECIYEESGGDLRRAITILQTVSTMFGKNGKKVTRKHILEICGSIPNEIVSKFFWTCYTCPSFDDLELISKDIVYSGYSVTKFMTQLNEFIYTVPEKPKTSSKPMEIDDDDNNNTIEIDNDDEVKIMKEEVDLFVPAIEKAAIILKMSEIEKRVIEGGDEYLQLLALASHINQVHLNASKD